MNNVSLKFRKLVWIFFLLGGSFFSVLFDLYFFKKLFTDLKFHLFSFIIGLLLLRFVLTVAKNTGRTLAKYGKEGKVPRFETNKLVTNGVYSYMRHPMHLGLLFFPFAFAFLLGSPTFIFFIAPLEILIMLIMIKTVEEKEALEKFGEEYINYRKNVPFFCFKPKCIRELLKPVPPNKKTDS